MHKNKSFLAVITARSGSKGLKNKNIKDLCGKPLMVWSIEAGLKSQYIDKLVVSTDSTKYADIAKSYGADVPFLRPSYLSSDETSSFDVIKHALDYFKNNKNQEFNYTIILQPTSPLREASDIDKAIETIINKNANSLMGIVKVQHQHPDWLVYKDSDCYISPYNDKEKKAHRRQEMEDIFCFSGTIFIAKTHVLLSTKTFQCDNTIGYEMPKYKSIDIDDMEDFIAAEAMVRNIQALKDIRE